MVNIKNKTRLIVYIFLIITFTSLGSIGLWHKSKNIEIMEEETNPDEIVINTKNSKYELLAHLNTDISCETESCEKQVIIKTELPTAKVLSIKDYANYILLYDKTVKLVDVNSRKVEELNVTYSKDNVYLINLIDENVNTLENKGKEISNITYTGNNSIGYYNYKTKKENYKDLFQNIKQINNFYIGTTNQNELILYNIECEELLKITENINLDNLTSIKENNDYIHLNFKNETFITYDLTGKLISKITGKFNNITTSENEIYAYETNRVVTYNMNGKTKTTKNIRNYDIKYTYDSYLIAIKNNNLISLNLNNNEEKVITNMANKEIIEIAYKEKNTKRGMFIKIKDNTTEIPVNKEIFYNFETKEIELTD